MQKIIVFLKEYFIPHEWNDHRPHILRTHAVVFFFIVLFVSEGVFLAGLRFAAPHPQLSGVIISNVLVDETNQNRIDNNLPGLTVSPLLRTAAQSKADDMASKGYFAHTSPDGITPWYWFESVGYDFSYAGENLAVDFSDSQDVTTAWMNSPEHRANILNGNFTQIGIATADGEYEGHPAIYVVELFGTPALALPLAENTPDASVVSASAVPVSKNVPASAPKKSAPFVASASLPKATPVKIAPVVVTASNISETTTSVQDFIAVAAIRSAPAVLGTSEASQNTLRAPQSSFWQGLLTGPYGAVEYLLFGILVLFLLALSLNIFIKIRIQHPQLIMGGMVVVIAAASFIYLNQYLFSRAITVL